MIWHQKAAPLIFLMFSFLVTYPLVFNIHENLVYLTDFAAPHWEDLEEFLNSILYMREVFSGNSQPLLDMLHSSFSYSLSYSFLAALLSFLVGPIVAHNIFFIGSIFLASWMMYLFVKRHVKDDISCLYAGFSFGSCNYMIHHFAHGHANQVQLFWIPFVFWMLERVLSETRKMRNGIYLGLILSGVLISNDHFALYLSLFIPIYILIRARFQVLLSLECLKALTLSAITFFVTSSWYLYLKIGHQKTVYTKNDSLIFSLQNPFDLINPDKEAHLGIVLLLLVFAALFLQAKNFWRSKSQDRRLPAMLIISFFALALSFGPFSDWAPYSVLYEYVPFFLYTRTPVRLVVFALAGFCFLAACGLAEIRAKLGWSKKLIFTVAVFLGTYAFHHHRSSLYFRADEAKAIWVKSFPIRD
ncbi:MAG: hypothetical protein KA436_01830 [Oligoflexales bacterium]|nr:hypothetical protein [Oligoflexales bacterium]